MWIGKRKEILKLTFRALALHQSQSALLILTIKLNKAKEDSKIND